MTQSEILAETADATRDLAFFYLKNVSEDIWHKEFELDGKKYNSIAWQLAHMAWAQNHLVLEGTGGTTISKDWYSKVKIHAPQIASSELPSVDELKNTFNEVHVTSISHIKSLSDEQLIENNLINSPFKRGNNKLMCIVHHIRHEGMHIGQISWLVKMHGIKTL